MTNRIRLIALLLLLIISTILTSCSEEFLKREPLGVAAGSVISTPEGVEAVLIGAYESMRGAVYNPEQDDFWPLTKDQVDLQKGILMQDSSYLNYKY